MSSCQQASSQHPQESLKSHHTNLKLSCCKHYGFMSQPAQINSKARYDLIKFQSLISHTQASPCRLWENSTFWVLLRISAMPQRTAPQVYINNRTELCIIVVPRGQMQYQGRKVWWSITVSRRVSFFDWFHRQVKPSAHNYFPLSQEKYEIASWNYGILKAKIPGDS